MHNSELRGINTERNWGAHRELAKFLRTNLTHSVREFLLVNLVTRERRIGGNSHEYASLACLTKEMRPEALILRNMVGGERLELPASSV